MRLQMLQVGIVVLLAATSCRLVVYHVLLAQDLGKTLTAAPVSIKYFAFVAFVVDVQ